MFKRNQEQIHFLARIIDILATMIAFFAAYWVRQDLLGEKYGSLAPITVYVWMLGVSLALHLAIYGSLGFYQSLRLKTYGTIFKMVLKATLVEFFLISALVFLLQEKETSRYFFLLFVGLNFALILIEKWIVKILLSTMRERGYNYRNLLIMGTGETADRLIERIQESKHWGYRLTGILQESEGASSFAKSDVRGVPVVGTVNDLNRVLTSQTVDEVFLALDSYSHHEISRITQVCETLGIPLRFCFGILTAHSRISFIDLSGLPILTFYTVMMTPIESFIKRTLDIMGALFGLAITAVLFPWIRWKIQKESPGPVIFKQYRVGENGRQFKCYKFRTMSLDAEEKKAELAAQNQMSGAIFKIKDDPRIFAFGAFLRKTSLDELPQFLNVLRGEMSLVGTRPPTPDEVSQYTPAQRRRLSMRPGITGLWQVSGRNKIQSFDEVVALDLKYMDDWSLGLDIRILAKTVWVVFFGRGAY